MNPNNVHDDGETEPRPLPVVRAAEFLEDGGQLFRRDTGTGIFHGDFDSPVHGPGKNRYLTVLGRELCRVPDKVP